MSKDLRDDAGNHVGLRNKSSEVLACLAARPGEIVTKAEIMAAVWPDVVVTDESLTQCVADIRRAIGDKKQALLKTHVGKGYCLNSESTQGTPRRAYVQWAFAVISVALAVAVSAWTFQPDPDTAGRNRIAVLAFDDLSAGDDKGYLGDGIAEGIITELASYHEFGVIARNSSFSFRDEETDIQEIARKLRADYIVEGSKQKSGNRLRVTVQLIDGNDGTHMWAQEFNSDIGELFDVQSKIVRSIAVQIGRELIWRAPQAGGREKISALHYYLQGNATFSQSTRESVIEARDLYLKAIEADPDAAFGYVGMALIFWFDATQRWVYPEMSREERIRRGVEYAERALEIDRNYANAHLERGDMHFIAGEHEAAIVRYKNAADLNPSDTDALVLQTDPLIYLNRAEEAITLVRQAIDLNPIVPEWYYKSLAFAQWAAGHCDEGLRTIKMKSRFRPWDLRHLMVLQACAGDLKGAAETVARHREAEPDYTVQTYFNRNRELWNNPDLMDRWLNDMRRAGMPEG